MKVQCDSTTKQARKRQCNKKRTRERQKGRQCDRISLSLFRPFCRTVVAEIATVRNVRYQPPPPTIISSLVYIYHRVQVNIRGADY